MKTACQLLGGFHGNREGIATGKDSAVAQAEDRSSQGLLEKHCLDVDAATWMWLRNPIQVSTASEATKAELFVTAANSNYPN